MLNQEIMEVKDKLQSIVGLVVNDGIGENALVAELVELEILINNATGTCRECERVMKSALRFLCQDGRL